MKLDKFTQAYLNAMFFTEDEEGEYNVHDINEKSLGLIISDCQDFQEKYSPLFNGRDEDAGHDFWLTRNNHGSGFWDGDWPENGEALTNAAHAYKEVSLVIGDNEELYYE